MKKILLDTSVIIDFLRRKDKEQTLFFKLLEEDLAISIISHTELYAGRSVWEKTKAKNELAELFSGLSILPLEEKISYRAGFLKANTPANSLLDCIIGATSLVYNLELATLNIKDFQKMEGVRLLKTGSLRK